MKKLDGKIAVVTGALKGIRASIYCDRLVSSCLFVDPELAHVGLTETEAQQQGYAIQVAKLDASAVPRAKTLGQTDGVMRAIVDTQTGRILGCSLLCHIDNLPRSKIAKVN